VSEGTQRPASPYLLDVSRWWSLPVPMPAALSWLEAHPPPGLPVSGHGSGTGPDGPFAYLIYQDGPTAAYNLATLVVEFAPNGPGASAMRADGQTLWVPPRPASEQVPTDVSRVRLVAYPGVGVYGVLARETVKGAAADRLVRLANALQRDNRGVVHCAADTGFRITVTFLAPQRMLVFTEVPACGSVSVTSDGNSEPGLLNSAGFQRVVRADLGLPSNAQLERKPSVRAASTRSSCRPSLPASRGG